MRPLDAWLRPLLQKQQPLSPERLQLWPSRRIARPLFALGGFAAGSWGIYPAFVIDGFTFFLSAFFILRIDSNISVAVAAKIKTVGDALRDYVDGLKYLRQNIDTFVVTLLKASVAFSVFDAFLGPIFARYFTGDRDRHLRIAIMWGYLITALGAMWAGWLASRSAKPNSEIEML